MRSHTWLHIRQVYGSNPMPTQACLDITLPYTRSRQQFEEKMGNFQLSQAKLADMYTATVATRSYLYATAAAADAGAYP
jgi:isovaleryl-CoA dehydrogenase